MIKAEGNQKGKSISLRLIIIYFRHNNILFVDGLFVSVFLFFLCAKTKMRKGNEDRSKPKWRSENLVTGWPNDAFTFSFYSIYSLFSHFIFDHFSSTRRKLKMKWCEIKSSQSKLCLCNSVQRTFLLLLLLLVHLSWRLVLVLMAVFYLTARFIRTHLKTF